MGRNNSTGPHEAKNDKMKHDKMAWQNSCKSTEYMSKPHQKEPCRYHTQPSISDGSGHASRLRPTNTIGPGSAESKSHQNRPPLQLHCCLPRWGRCTYTDSVRQPSIRAILPRVRNITAFSSTALRAQQSMPTTTEAHTPQTTLTDPINDRAVGPPTAARLPLSVQAIYYKPLHRLPQHGLPVCNLMLRSYSVRQLDAQCDFALRAAYYLNMPATGVVSLPRKIKLWTVPRSNFVHKKSQENYMRITHKRVIQIMDTNPDVVELWLAFLKKHAVHGVGMKAYVWAFEEVGMWFWTP